MIGYLSVGAMENQRLKRLSKWEFSLVQVVDLREVKGMTNFMEFVLNDGKVLEIGLVFPILIQRVKNEVQVGSIIRAQLDWSDALGKVYVKEFQVVFKRWMLVGRPIVVQNVNRESLQNQQIKQEIETEDPSENRLSLEDQILGGIEKELKNGQVFIEDFRPFKKISFIQAQVVWVSQDVNLKTNVLTAILADKSGSIECKVFDDKINKFKQFLVKGNMLKISRPVQRNSNSISEPIRVEYLIISNETKLELIDKNEEISFAKHAANINGLNDIKNGSFVYVMGIIVEEIQYRQNESLQQKGYESKYFIIQDETGQILVMMSKQIYEQEGLGLNKIVLLEKVQVNKDRRICLKFLRTSSVYQKVTKTEKYEKLRKLFESQNQEENQTISNPIGIPIYTAQQVLQYLKDSQDYHQCQNYFKMQLWTKKIHHMIVFIKCIQCSNDLVNQFGFEYCSKCKDYPKTFTFQINLYIQMIDDTGRILIDINDTKIIETLLGLKAEEIKEYSYANKLYLLYRELPLKQFDVIVSIQRNFKGLKMLRTRKFISAQQDLINITRALINMIE